MTSFSYTLFTTNSMTSIPDHAREDGYRVNINFRPLDNS
jgi:hypothetical protein